MTSSLVRYSNEVGAGGGRVFWDRVSVDGAPFRGPFAPIMPDAEYEARVVRVADFRNGFFDVRDDVQNAAYCRVMERCANGWYQLRKQVDFWNGTTQHYVEWLEYFMEDGTRTPFCPNGVTELAHGQQLLNQQYPGAG